VNKAIFVDKDGTLIVDIPYNTDPSLIQFQEGALKSLKILQDRGYLIIIVSNQSGLSKGYFKEEDLECVKNAIEQRLLNANVKLSGFYFCPHHPEGTILRYAQRCDCRKPLPGMLLKAAQDFDIDLTRSWMIGNTVTDIEAGKRAGCFTILINNQGNLKISDRSKAPTLVAQSIGDIGSFILKDTRVS